MIRAGRLGIGPKWDLGPVHSGWPLIRVTLGRQNSNRSRNQIEALVIDRCYVPVYLRTVRRPKHLRVLGDERQSDRAGLGGSDKDGFQGRRIRFVRKLGLSRREQARTASTRASAVYPAGAMGFFKQRKCDRSRWSSC